MSDKRKVQLVAREGVLSQIIEDYKFPNCTPEARAEHEKVLQLLHEETVEEMEELGLKELKEEDEMEELRRGYVEQGRVKLAIFWVVFITLIMILCFWANAEPITVQCNDGVEVDIIAPEGVLLNEQKIKEMEWIRGVSGDFEVISLDNEKGLFIEENVNGVKKRVLPKWGFGDIKLNAPVRMMVVPDAATMSRLFRLLGTKVEPFRKHKDKTLHVIYLVVEDTPAKTLNKPITKLMLSEWEKKYSSNIGFWAKQGMSSLSLPAKNVKETLLKTENGRFSAEALFGMTEQHWKELNKEDRELFDNQCALLVLMIRKEFGEKSLHKLIKNDPKKMLIEVFDFSDMNHFNRSYQRFRSDVLREIKQDKMPDHYLQITPA